jgi:2,4-dienoyl-CoA reductase-like NADH-dependent reductase (Old Yellow Enzyme family)
MKIGKMEVKNRFVRSATLENMANEDGTISNELISVHTSLAKGNVGLIIPGYMYVHPLGRAYKYQTGIYKDDQIQRLRNLSKAIHKENGKVAFQIVHAGMQAFSRLIGEIPAGPSGDILNPVSIEYSREITEEEIWNSIDDFVQAAERGVAAEVDAIQLHAAHGYLINQFLSPFYNRRNDDWGGSDEKRFKFLREIIMRTKKVLPSDIPLLIKLSTHDYTPENGILPPLAAKYSEWMVQLGIDAIETSCGSGTFAIFNMSRGNVPVKEILQAIPDYMKDMAEEIYGDMVGKFSIKEGYNLDATKLIRAQLKDTPLILVGGLRSKSFIEEVLKKKYADFISMSRPFIREPFLVKEFEKQEQFKVACISCNRCLAAIPNNYPIRCYSNKWPKEPSPITYFAE